MGIGADVGRTAEAEAAVQTAVDKLAGLHILMENAGVTTPVRRIGTPDDVAAVATFPDRDEASYVTGQTRYVDRGETVV